MSLSKEAEAKIVAALDAVVDLVNEGTNPTEAIVKIASERQIPSGHVRIMVHSFNIGRSEAQRKGSTDLFEKVSEFDLADASDVLEKMFPSTVKSAGVLTEEATVSDQYRHPPHFLAERARRVKQAAARAIDWAMVETPPPPLPRDPHTAVKRAYSKLVGLKSTCEELRRAAQFQFDRVSSLSEKLAADLRGLGAAPFHEVRANSVRLFGKVAEALFDDIGRKHPLLVKQAQADRDIAVDIRNEPYGTVKSIVEAVSSFQMAKEAYEKAEAKRETEAGEIVRPFASAAPEPGSVLGPFSNEKTGSFLGGLFGTALGSSMGREMGGKLLRPTESLKGSMRDKVNDPQHEASLRNIQTESMLNDLMANDDVISGYDPNEVIGHFNEISQLSPRSTNQSGLMRTLLRKRLQQGALDPYEIDLLLKIENGLKTRDNQPPRGILSESPGVM